MTRFLATSALFVMLLLVFGASMFFFSNPRNTAYAFSSSTGYSLVNSENIGDYGQFSVNDTLVISANATGSLASATFGYPAAYYGHMYLLNATVSNEETPSVSIQPVSNTTLVTISWAQPLIASGNVSLSFFVLGTYANLNTTASSCSPCYYNMPMLFYPQTSVPIGSLNSTITFTDSGTTGPSSNMTAVAYHKFGFTATPASAPSVISLSTDNSTDLANATSVVHWSELSLTSASGSGGIVDFQKITRVISVSTTGGLLVTDSFTIRNLGPNTLTSIPLTLLTNPNVTSVSVIPTGQVLLSNYDVASVSTQTLTISSLPSINFIEPNSSLFVEVQYPLGQQYWNYSFGTYKVQIPLGAPVSAVVDKYTINYNIPQGFITVTKPPSGGQSWTNALGGSGSTLFSYSVGVGSAFSFLLPISFVVFLAVFIAALLFKPRGGEKKSEEVESTLVSLVKAAEDKVSGTNEILTDLKSKGSSLTRIDLSTARTRVEELRSKSSGRFGTIRAELADAGSSAQAALTQVASDDREFDRAVRDILNTYDQFISKKMKQDSFARSVQNSERRIQRITNSLLDGLEDLRHDYEQEQ